MQEFLVPTASQPRRISLIIPAQDDPGTGACTLRRPAESGLQGDAAEHRANAQGLDAQRIRLCLQAGCESNHQADTRRQKTA